MIILRVLKGYHNITECLSSKSKGAMRILSAYRPGGIATMYCPKCGVVNNNEAAKFCSSCGASLSAPQASNATRSAQVPPQYQTMRPTQPEQGMNKRRKVMIVIGIIVAVIVLIIVTIAVINAASSNGVQVNAVYLRSIITGLHQTTLTH